MAARQSSLFGSQARLLSVSGTTRRRPAASASAPRAVTAPKAEHLSRVRDVNTGELGTVVSKLGGWYKVRWDDRTRPSLIARDQVVKANPHTAHLRPTRKRNLEQGFTDETGFHPIRKSEGYNEFLAGDFDTEKQQKRRQFKAKSGEREREAKSAKEWEDFEAKEARRAVRGAGSKRTARSLAQFVRKRGGIAPGRGGMYAGELARLGRKESGTSGLINQNARQGNHRQTAEYVMDAANVDGYRDRHGRKFSNIGDFILALEEDATGQRKYYNFEAMNNGRKSTRRRGEAATRGTRNGKSADVSKRLPSFRNFGIIAAAEGLQAADYLERRLGLDDEKKKKNLGPRTRRVAAKLPRGKKNMGVLETLSHSAVIISGIPALKQMLSSPPKHKARRPSATAAGKRLAERKHGHVAGRTKTVKRTVKNPQSDNLSAARVTPAMARNMLHGTRNADMVQARIDAIAAKMKAGTYAAKMPLLFKNGKLIDGRHRLNAVMKSGVPTIFVIEKVVTNPEYTVDATPTLSSKRIKLKAITMGRAASKAKRQLGKYRGAYKLKVEKNPKPVNRNSKPSPKPKHTAATARITRDFLGREPNGRARMLYTPPGSPKQVGAMATLAMIEMANGSRQTFAVRFDKRTGKHTGDAMIGGVQNGDWRRMHIGLKQPLSTPNGIDASKPVNAGEVKKAWYWAAKPHLYGTDKEYLFHHEMGEEGGERPDLILHQGCLAFKGGSYQVEPEGIRN